MPHLVDNIVRYTHGTHEFFDTPSNDRCNIHHAAKLGSYTTDELENLHRTLLLHFFLEKSFCPSCDNMRITFYRRVFGIQHIDIVQKMTERVEYSVRDVIDGSVQRFSGIPLQKVHTTESTHSTATYSFTMKRCRNIRDTVSKLHEHFHKLCVRRNIRRHIEKSERWLVTIRDIGVHHVHHTGNYVSEVILSQILAYALVIGFAERSRRICCISH